MDTAVGLAQAYLELCGYFVLAELPVRAAENGAYHGVTDLDIVAVRFPHPPLALPQRITRPLEVFLVADSALETFDTGVDVIIGRWTIGRITARAGFRQPATPLKLAALDSHAARVTGGGRDASRAGAERRRVPMELMWRARSNKELNRWIGQ